MRGHFGCDGMPSRGEAEHLRQPCIRLPSRSSGRCPPARGRPRETAGRRAAPTPAAASSTSGGAPSRPPRSGRSNDAMSGCGALRLMNEYIGPAMVGIGRHRVRRRIVVGVEAVPHVGRLIRVDAGPADLPHQQPAGGQRLVAHHLGGHPQAREPREQQVVRILLQQLLIGVRLLAIRTGHHDQLVQLLDVPT